MIIKADKSDAGEYKITASNETSRLSCSASLLVVGMKLVLQQHTSAAANQIRMNVHSIWTGLWLFGDASVIKFSRENPIDFMWAKLWQMP